MEGQNKVTHETKKKSNKLKSFIGNIFYFHFLYQLSVLLCAYLLYKCVYEKSVISGAIVAVVCTYQYYFAKRSERFIRFIKWLDLPGIFEDWSCHMEQPLKNNKSMIAFHPHCIFNIAFIWNNSTNYEVVPLASRMILNIPFIGIFIRYLGVQSVDAQSMKDQMKQGKNIGLLPGGFEEATLTSQKENRIYIKSRKGFIKYALQYGYTIYPAYGFGENKAYYTVEKFLSLRLLLNKYKLVGAFFLSKFGWVPNNNISIHTVVGKGIELPHILNPTEQDVNKYHEIYLNELTNLFDKYKKQYNEGDAVLKLY